MYWIHTIWSVEPGMDEQRKHVDIVVLVMTIAWFGIRVRCVMGEKRGCSLMASYRCHQFTTQERR